MNHPPFFLNLVVAWLGILLGFISGLALGLRFHQEGWLGGYGSFQRRLYRLAHISFFGLAFVNLVFYWTAQRFAPGNLAAEIASRAFIVGAVSMPLCCVLLAHFRRTHQLFGVPVLSLITGAVLTLFAMTLPPPPAPTHDFPVTTQESSRL